MRKNSKQVGFATSMISCLLYCTYYGISHSTAETDIDTTLVYYILILIYITAMEYRRRFSQQTESSRYLSTSTIPRISFLAQGITMKLVPAPENIIVSMFHLEMVLTILPMYPSSRRSWSRY